MKQLFLFALVLISSAGISACSVKASGGGDSAPAVPKEKSVKGPDLSGTWASGCQRSNFGEFKSFDVVFAGNTVSRKSTTYADAQCAQVTDSKTDAGTFRYLAANKDGSFTVEYRIPIGNGVSALPQEKILLDNGVLYLSDFAIGDAITKDSMVALHKAPPPAVSRR